MALEVVHRHKKLAPESGFEVMVPISGACVGGLTNCFSEFYHIYNSCSCGQRWTDYISRWEVKITENKCTLPPDAYRSVVCCWPPSGQCITNCECKFYIFFVKIWLFISLLWLTWYGHGWWQIKCIMLERANLLEAIFIRMLLSYFTVCDYANCTVRRHILVIGWALLCSCFCFLCGHLLIGMTLSLILLNVEVLAWFLSGLPKLDLLM